MQKGGGHLGRCVHHHPSSRLLVRSTEAPFSRNKACTAAVRVNRGSALPRVTLARVVGPSALSTTRMRTASSLVEEEPGQRSSEADARLVALLAYHERSKHSFQRYAAGPGYLDWCVVVNT